MIVNVFFYVFGAVLVASAIGVITARNPVHCALFLVAAFLNSAVIWLLLTVTLAGWWMWIGLSQAQQLRELNGPDAARLERVQRMRRGEAIPAPLDVEVSDRG